MARRNSTEVVRVFGVVRLVPTRAEPEDEASAADVVNGAGHVREQLGVAKPRSADQTPELSAARELRPSGQCRPALEVGQHGRVGRGDGPTVLVAAGDRWDQEMVIAEGGVGTDVLGAKDCVAPDRIAECAGGRT